MPELPDVEHMRRKLMPARGRRIADIRVYDREFVGLASTRKLIGGQIKEISRRGKFILIYLSTNQVIIAHMGMTGDMNLNHSSAPPDTYVKCSFQLSGNKRIDYTCTRKFGLLISVQKDELGGVPLLSELGPEPLSRAFTEQSFLQLMGRSKGRIKSFLLNQRRIAGMGNLCADEILFHARINPIAKIDNLSRDRLKKLYQSIRTVLRKFVEGYTNEIRMRRMFVSYRDENANCPRCRSKIRRIEVGGRGTYYCPRCQRR